MNTRLLHHIGLALVVSLLGCSSPFRAGSVGNEPSDTLDPNQPFDNLDSVEVTPPTAQVVHLNGSSAGVDFQAIGHFKDGRTVDLTSVVTWSLADSSLGEVVAGHYAALSVDHGGATNVIANAGGVTGTATLTLKLKVVRVSSDAGSSAPSNSESLFASATPDPALQPEIVYPIDQTRVPSNLNVLEVQWSSGGGSLYEVSIEHPHFSLRVYTNAAIQGGSSYAITQSEWDALTKSIDDSSALFAVRSLALGTGGAAARVGTSRPVNVEIARGAVQGGIYYWAAGGGIMRQDFGDKTTVPTAFYSDSDAANDIGSQGHCLGCHALSRDGRRFAVSMDSGNPYAALLDVATKNKLVLPNGATKWTYSAFSPDGNRMVAAQIEFAGAPLRIIDASGGTETGSVQTTIIGTGILTHPAWSPDGKSIAFIQAPAGQNPGAFTGGSIVIAEDDGTGTFATQRVLVASEGENNYYPSFSPDSQWILFNRADGSAYSNVAAEVWTVRVDGTMEPVRLMANQMLTDSWPIFAPFASSYQGKTLYYFTLSSKRSYGLKLSAGARTQLWMASFSPDNVTPTGIDAVAAGVTAPFWLPFQDMQTSNHDAQWAEKIIPTIN